MTSSASEHFEAVVVGAGIVGAACALELVEAGLGVAVFEFGQPGGRSTAACMGHIVVMDDSPAQLRLTRASRTLWDTLADDLPAAVERDVCGTLWLAASDDEMMAVEAKRQVYAAAGIEVEVLDSTALREAEPELAHDLLGALRVPGDSVVYPPAAVDWMLARAAEMAASRGQTFELRPETPVDRVDAHRVVLHDGMRMAAKVVVDAAGVRALALLPAASRRALAGHAIRPRKGHLVITDRHPGFCRHQLVELGYLASAHGDSEATGAETSVAFNLQPRVTGQMLLGSSRQFVDITRPPDRSVDSVVVRRMIDRARRFMPRIGELRAIRAWAGFRPSTDDHLPLIGPVPGGAGRALGGVVLAAGHEGLGITTALATARLVAHHALHGTDVLDTPGGRLDPSCYRPDRPAPQSESGESRDG
ncbi:MAG: FAD-binding oxidoreductase [Acidobacteriota bacterium]